MCAWVMPSQDSQFIISFVTISCSNCMMGAIALFITFSDGSSDAAIHFFIFLSSPVVLLSSVSVILAKVPFSLICSPKYFVAYEFSLWVFFQLHSGMMSLIWRLPSLQTLIFLHLPSIVCCLAFSLSCIIHCLIQLCDVILKD